MCKEKNWLRRTDWKIELCFLLGKFLLHSPHWNCSRRELIIGDRVITLKLSFPGVMQILRRIYPVVKLIVTVCLVIYESRITELEDMQEYMYLWIILVRCVIFNTNFESLMTVWKRITTNVLHREVGLCMELELPKQKVKHARWGHKSISFSPLNENIYMVVANV